MKLKKVLLAAFAVALGAVPAMADEARQPAFPGAEGYGRYVTGGRGGKVVHVTNLEDSGEGSFRWACQQSGARTIVFDISGTIMLKSELRLRNGNVTIAGQTAPGDGICVANYPFVISAPNVIIRFVRFRLGNEALKTNKNAHEGDGLGGMDTQNVIIDHCSVSWSIDECLSVYGSKNITVQWCMATQSLVNSGHSKGAHGYGGNWGGSGASYHHNLIAHHGSRTPRLGPRPGTQTDERMDLRNNVMYNFGGNGCYGGEGMNVNIVNNYYKPGPATPAGGKGKRIAAPGIRTIDYCLNKNSVANNINAQLGTKYKGSDLKASSTKDRTGKITDAITYSTHRWIIDLEKDSVYLDDGKRAKLVWNDWKAMLHKWGTYYVTGNVNSQYEDVTADNWKLGLYDQIALNSSCDFRNPGGEIRLWTPIEFVNTTTHSAEVAYEKVLAYAGASLHRDAYDEMMVSDARNGEASCIVSGIGKGFINSQDEVVYPDGTTGWPKLNSLEPAADTDGDGMPDAWEKENGLDPNNAEDGVTLREDGYTNLEHYLNSLVADIMAAGNEDGVMLTGNEVYTDAAVDEIFGDSVRPTDNRVFNLMGVEVNRENLAPGIYISNGRKFIVK